MIWKFSQTKPRELFLTVSEIRVLNSCLHHKLKILKLEDFISLEIGKFAINFENCSLPKIFHSCFCIALRVHNRSTRSTENNLLYLPAKVSN